MIRKAARSSLALRLAALFAAVALGLLIMLAIVVANTSLGFTWYMRSYVPRVMERQLTYLAVPAEDGRPGCAIFNEPDGRNSLRESRDSLLQLAWSEHLRLEAKQAWEAEGAATRISTALWGAADGDVDSVIAKSEQSFRTIYGAFESAFRPC
jgi:hypothetical protein